jgi:phosphoribosylglycinamide formyltransferase-1
VSILRLGVLVSGSGTNLQAILDAITHASLPAELAVVISNKPDALALARAEKAGVSTEVVPHRDFPSREAFDAKLVERLQHHRVECVVLAGFMRIVTPVLLAAFPDRVVNIHPSLLPAFPGTNAQAQALDYGVRVAGCTVHLVDGGTDTGPILAQATVDVLEGDTVESLTARILAEEHRLLPSVLRAIAEGRVRVVRGTSGARTRTIVSPAHGG